MTSQPATAAVRVLRAELSDGDVHIGRHAAGPALDALKKALRE